MLRVERAEIFLVCTEIVTFWDTLVANKVKKLSNKFVWGRRQFGGSIPRAPLATCLRISNLQSC